MDLTRPDTPRNDGMSYTTSLGISLWNKFLVELYIENKNLCLKPIILRPCSIENFQAGTKGRA